MEPTEISLANDFEHLVIDVRLVHGYGFNIKDCKSFVVWHSGEKSFSFMCPDRFDDLKAKIRDARQAVRELEGMPKVTKRKTATKKR